jgi:MATE family multidrug resistance protein
MEASVVPLQGLAFYFVQLPLAMASMHYGTPSSLPSDYALLSHYANARENTNSDDTIDDIYGPTELNAQDEILPSPYFRPLQPKLPEPFASKISVPDEYTPLLVPRIVEEVGTGTDPIHPQCAAKIFRDEFRIQLKYALPVLGYVSSFGSRLSLNAVYTELTCLNTPW